MQFLPGAPFRPSVATGTGSGSASGGRAEKADAQTLTHTRDDWRGQPFESRDGDDRRDRGADARQAREAVAAFPRDGPTKGCGEIRVDQSTEYATFLNETGLTFMP